MLSHEAPFAENDHWMKVARACSKWLLNKAAGSEGHEAYCFMGTLRGTNDRERSWEPFSAARYCPRYQPMPYRSKKLVIIVNVFA